ncbi:hypothetical protein AGABI1DRAFT_125068 [Agaricus bisporus var. burnettii JB137-S8]|uniref:Uncharacterized protein n=1 Tax=Agaricus bisporus var. burnettii (strain JB137-S8 / ATCC MYA-4627 / FGSC 10392) TaxID=597362 RepID=K5W716_AGABU|nr:uncharacterized protein AGABI1DRAFT_125068 [Agaricus bisporus var. burnettii JB137-S8]EKM82604.1 hypothetical protein AGABI1DRAFT_125068 [Agaricus bisporus var. burnettii JB137-S8]
MSTSNGVHNRIHTLRGEQFRHLQNLRGSRSHLTSTNIHGVPSLPFRLLSLVDPSFKLIDADDLTSPFEHKSTLDLNATDSKSDGTSLRPPAGPTPPKSWMLNTKKDIRGSTSWRAEALSLVLYHLSTNGQTPSTLCGGRSFAAATPRIPSLSLLCLQQFLTICTTSEFCGEVVPGIPPHLRKDLIRFSAVHSPLNNIRLYALWEETGHVDGEMILVGPYATLKDDHFNKSSYDHSSITGIPRNENEGNWDWDNEDTESIVPLSTLILLNTTLSTSTLFDLPPTLTHIALINVSTPIPLHRLPKLCPLLTFFDLSYNSWLGTTFIDGLDAEGRGITGTLGDPQPPTDLTTKAIVDLGRVDWLKWNHLKVLGFRGNYVPDDLVTRVNEKRWDDVEIIL